MLRMVTPMRMRPCAQACAVREFGSGTVGLGSFASDVDLQLLFTRGPAAADSASASAATAATAAASTATAVGAHGSCGGRVPLPLPRELALGVLRAVEGALRRADWAREVELRAKARVRDQGAEQKFDGRTLALARGVWPLPARAAAPLPIMHACPTLSCSSACGCLGPWSVVRVWPPGRMPCICNPAMAGNHNVQLLVYPAPYTGCGGCDSQVPIVTAVDEASGVCVDVGCHQDADTAAAPSSGGGRRRRRRGGGGGGTAVDAEADPSASLGVPVRPRSSPAQYSIDYCIHTSRAY